MFVNDSGFLFAEEGDSFRSIAGFLRDADYREEFVFSTELSPERVEEAALAGFMPMAYRFPGKAVFTPKLHTVRVLMDPARARMTKTARRESRRYKIRVNTAFKDVVNACQNQHGEDWLLPELAQVFIELHERREHRRVKFISFELYEEENLVAGEFGYNIGASYASMSGFTKVSGAGTVQIYKMAEILAENRIRLWDLGMPLEYKTRLGGREYSRQKYMRFLEYAYALQDFL